MTVGDTIFALSSGAPPAGVAVIRISGDGVKRLLIEMAGKIPPPRHALLATVRDSDGMPLDTGLVLFFPGPNSFTGEDIAEFQLHGGRATVTALLRDIGERPGYRQAEPGEFTRRAFLNGRLDLTAVEAFSDLIAAETEAQRRFSLRNSSGSQRQLYENWRERIIRIRAFIEAGLDFSEEEDVAGLGDAAIWGEVDRLRDEIEAHVEGFHRAEIIRDGFDVVIVGRPNAGKSTLLNALARRDAAIVSEEAGTTRDLVEVALDLGGLKVRLTDTAGIRETSGKVERIGIERAQNRARGADLVLILDDGGNFDVWDGPPERALRVATKSDLGVGAGERADMVISAEVDTGLDKLVAEIRLRAEATVGNVASILPSRQRHVTQLRATAESLAKVRDEANRGMELAAETLRIASDHLGRLVGRIDTEELLDVIFSEFCIGK